MANLPYPVIVVPGITATDLRNDYLLPPDFPWTVMTKNFEKIALHPNDLRYESIQPSRIQQGQIFKVVYSELIEELRNDLSPDSERSVPVYPFGYDWRQPLEIVEKQLGAFIDEVIDRTKLLGHYYADNYVEDPRVNLVGHSMGGLIIAGCIERMSRVGTAKKINKVASLGSPFKGSFEAVIKIATGTANLGGDVPSSRERNSARLFPSLYHLFPSIKTSSAIEIDSVLKGDSLFDIGLMQPSVLETIAEFIKKHGVKPSNEYKQAEILLDRILNQAKYHRNRIDNFKLNDAGLTENDWLCVVGVDCVTRVKMQIQSDGGKPRYNLCSDHRKNEWNTKDATSEQRKQTGDGTVPFDGAIPGFLELENLVCVTPDDFGYWELQDKAMAALGGFHGILPNMDMLHRLLTNHFKIPKGDSTVIRSDNIWGRPAPSVTKENWKPAVAGLKIPK